MIKRLSLLLMFFFHLFTGNAQLCTGSLGDPLVNISFGSGANPGPALAAAATGYQYVGSDCPADGFYTVRTNTNACFGNTWHTLNADHTGNANGYFMLVNASLQPSAFYVDTVRGLCGGSTYEFAAWIMNVILTSSCGSNSNQPNLTFTIERTNGVVLQTYNSGSIPPTAAPTWKQYGFFFTTPAGVNDIVLRMVNNAPGGCGNDLALDDITFRPCGPQLIPAIAGQNSISSNLCQGNAATYNYSCVVSSGFNNPVFQWQTRFNNGSWTDIPGATSTNFTNVVAASRPTGLYEYRLTVAEAGNIAATQCRISSLPIRLTINGNPTATASSNGPLCEGSDIELSASGGIQYVWTGPNGYAASTASPTIPRAALNQAGNYQVLVSNAEGCGAFANTTVIMQAGPALSLAFSDSSICEGGNLQLSAAGGTSYDWLPATGLSATNISNPIATPLVSTSYQVTVSNAAGCKDSARLSVTVNKKAVANAGPDKTIVAGGSTLLSGSIEGDYQSFQWNPSPDIPNPNILQPTVAPVRDAVYQLNVVSKNGCGSSTDEVMVNFYTGIFIPNAFTPNNDGLNDLWNIPALDAYPGFQLKVFNRYGQTVFENSQKSRPWDGLFRGQPIDPGTYVYIIKLNQLLPVLKGTINVLR